MKDFEQFKKEVLTISEGRQAVQDNMRCQSNE